MLRGTLPLGDQEMPEEELATHVEQYLRDVRIAMIYEGANGIQALDLVGRKLPAHMGRYLRRFFHPVQKWIDANTADATLQPFILPLAKAFGRLQIATGQIAQAGLKNPNEAGAASIPEHHEGVQQLLTASG